MSKRFDFAAFDRKLDAELLIQDAANAEQKAWQEHDALLDIVVIPVGEVDIAPNPYL